MIVDLYVDIKVLMDEYIVWKQDNQELLDYVTEYKNDVFNCLKEKEKIRILEVWNIESPSV